MPLFEKLRVSLDRAFDGPLIEGVQRDEHLSRTDYLRRAFSEKRDFVKSKRIYTFIPIEAPEGYVAGFFTRGRPVPLRRADLSPYTAENYEASLFLLSLDKAQIIWMEDRQTVGSPKGVIEAFFRHLMRKTDLKDWIAFVRYFEKKETFWNAVRNNKYRISKVVFRFVPPNAFEGVEAAQQFITGIQKEVDNDVFEQVLKGRPGKMKLDGSIFRATAEIAEQGAGERELRGPKNELIYSSREGRVIAKVEEGDMPTADSPAFVSRIINRLFE